MKNKFIILVTFISVFVSTTFIVLAKEKEILLNERIIYVDAGHGGKDNGASYESVLEDEINFNISSFLLKELIDMGASVYTSRDGDYDLASNYDKNRKSKDLRKRVDLINKIKPDIFVSIHLNTFPDSQVKGGQVFYQNNENSKLLASTLQMKFNNLSGENKQSKLGNYYILNKTHVTGVIVECGFLTNLDDIRNLTQELHQIKIAKLISKGIFEYFNLKT